MSAAAGGGDLDIGERGCGAVRGGDGASLGGRRTRRPTPRGAASPNSSAHMADPSRGSFSRSPTCTPWRRPLCAGLVTGGAHDPFGSGVAASKIHLAVQKNGRFLKTTLYGLDKDLDLKRICRAMRRAFNCNGNVADDEKFGEVIQLQGDQRELVQQFLVDAEILSKVEMKERLVVHGF